MPFCPGYLSLSTTPLFRQHQRVASVSTTSARRCALCLGYLSTLPLPLFCIVNLSALPCIVNLSALPCIVNLSALPCVVNLSALPSASLSLSLIKYFLSKEK